MHTHTLTCRYHIHPIYMPVDMYIYVCGVYSVKDHTTFDCWTSIKLFAVFVLYSYFLCLSIYLPFLFSHFIFSVLISWHNKPKIYNIHSSWYTLQQKYQNKILPVPPPNRMNIFQVQMNKLCKERRLHTRKILSSPKFIWLEMYWGGIYFEHYEEPLQIYLAK